jgi:hypothetical protein
MPTRCSPIGAKLGEADAAEVAAGGADVNAAGLAVGDDDGAIVGGLTWHALTIAATTIATGERRTVIPNLRADCTAACRLAA